jgi:hypothetical protein
MILASFGDLRFDRLSTLTCRAVALAKEEFSTINPSQIARPSDFFRLKFYFYFSLDGLTTAIRRAEIRKPPAECQMAFS